MDEWCKLSLRDREYTMIEPQGMKVLIDTVREAPPRGVMIIAGTAHGGDAMLIRKTFPNRHLIVIDSFEGLNDKTEKDGPDAEGKGGHNCGGLDQYKANFADLGRSLPHEIYKMWITEENLKEVGERQIAMLFMDLDHYVPVMACLRTFMPMMMPGGKILTHDWGFFRTVGVKKACEEFAPNQWEQIRGFGKYIGSI